MHGEGAQKFPNALRGIEEELALSEPFVKGLQLKPIALYTNDPFSPPTQEFSLNIKLWIIFLISF